jgi:hypothetical protein
MGQAVASEPLPGSSSSTPSHCPGDYLAKRVAHGRRVRYGIKPSAIKGIGILFSNTSSSERCVTVLNQPSDKKPSPRKPFRVPPLQHFYALVDMWVELSFCPFERPNAHKSRAFDVNNVLDFAERISFFWHNPYEKSFLDSSQNVLSSVVKSMKRFHL